MCNVVKFKEEILAFSGGGGIIAFFQFKAGEFKPSSAGKVDIYTRFCKSSEIFCTFSIISHIQSSIGQR